MTAYIRFLHNGMPIQGAVRSGAYAGWSELLGFSMGGRTSASGSRTVRIKTFVCPSDPAFGGALFKEALAGEGKRATIHFSKPGGSANQPDNLVAEVDFGAAGVRGAGLRVRIHGIRIVRYQRAANGLMPKTTNVLVASTYGRGVYQLATDDIVIAYSRMTLAGAPASAPDISQDVRGRLLLGSDQGVWATRRGGAALQVTGDLSVATEVL